MLGPGVLVFLVSGLLFVICPIFGRSRGYRSFVSVTALAFIPAAVYHMAQSLVLLSARPQDTPSL
jgi:hypothetical protein